MGTVLCKSTLYVPIIRVHTYIDMPVMDVARKMKKRYVYVACVCPLHSTFTETNGLIVHINTVDPSRGICVVI